MAGRIGGWLHDRGKTFRDAEGRIAYMTGACIDVTERKAFEMALREADHRKHDFLAMLAHELRNPLASEDHRRSRKAGSTRTWRSPWTTTPSW